MSSGWECSVTPQGPCSPITLLLPVYYSVPRCRQRGHCTMLPVLNPALKNIT